MGHLYLGLSPKGPQSPFFMWSELLPKSSMEAPRLSPAALLVNRPGGLFSSNSGTPASLCLSTSRRLPFGAAYLQTLSPSR